jgi:hypothetical protein
LKSASSVEGPLLTKAQWYVGENILEFLERSYDSTVVMSGVYYPTSLFLKENYCRRLLQYSLFLSLQMVTL